MELTEAQRQRLREAAEKHVESLRGTTLVGRAFDMSEEQSREELATWLTKHTEGVLRHL